MQRQEIRQEVRTQFLGEVHISEGSGDASASD